MTSKTPTSWISRTLPAGVGLLILSAAPFYLFPASERWQGLLLLPLAGLLAWIGFRRPLPITPLNPSILLMGGMILLSTWTTYSLSLSLPKIAGLIWGIALFFAVASFGQYQRGWTICIIAFILSGTGVALLSWAGMLVVPALTHKISWFMPLSEKFPAILTGWPGAVDGFHPNEISGALSWLVLPALSLFLSSFVKRPIFQLAYPGRWIRLTWRLFWIIVLGLNFILVASILALSQSRSGYLGVFFAFLVWVFLLLKRTLRRVVAGVGLSVGIALMILAAPFVQTVTFQWQSIDLTYISPALNTVSIGSRITYWSDAFLTIRDFPLTGIGFNTFRYTIFQLFPLVCDTSVCDIAHAHNELMQAALDLGIPGLIAFLSLYLGAIWMLAKLFIISRCMGVNDFPLKLVTIGLGGGLLAHFIYGLTDAVALGAKPGFLFWMILGLICGLYHQFEHSTAEVYHAN